MERMKRLLSIIYILGGAISVNAQQVFENHLILNTFSDGYQVLEIPGEGFYTIGYNDSVAMDSNGVQLDDFFEGLIVKFDYNGDTVKTCRMGWGDTLFAHLYGRDSQDGFRTGILTDDGNIMVLGETESYNATNFFDYDLWLVKLDPDLDTLWTQTYSVPDSQIAAYYSVAAKNQYGGLTVAGYQKAFINGYSQSQITFFDSSGNLLFHQRLLPQNRSALIGVAQTADKGFLCSGYQYNNGFPDDVSPLIIKTDSMGREQWHYTLPYYGNIHIATNIASTQDGNYVFAWSEAVLNPGASHWVWVYHATKIDEQGNQMWTRDYTYSYDGNIRVHECPNSNLLFCGLFRDTLQFGIQAWLMLCDSAGNRLWERKFYGAPGPSPGSSIYPKDAIATHDGGIVLTGQTLCCNFVPNMGWTSVLWIMKTDSLGLITSVSNLPGPALRGAILGEPYPNPAAQSVVLPTIIPPGSENVYLMLFDAQGRQLQEIKTGIGMNQTRIDLSSCTGGVYYIALSIDGFNAGVKKIIKR